jgi:hypothetical protein
MTDLRAICNLTDEQYAARQEELRAGLLTQARRREALSNGLALYFDASPEMREELDALVAFERKCCPSLGFTVSESPDALRLEIRGIDPDTNFASGEESSSPAPRKRLGWPRMLRSIGLGGALSLFLCCIAPIGIAAVVGVGLAAPFAVLENPWVIVGGGIVFAGLLWFRDRRRADVRMASASTGECGG